jgi:hypothetical protein
MSVGDKLLRPLSDKGNLCMTYKQTMLFSSVRNYRRRADNM